MLSSRSRPSRYRCLARLLLTSAALCLQPAFAADKPATPEGAQALQGLFSKYLPPAGDGAPPLVTVAPEGADYVISADLSAINGLIKAVGGSTAYDPATIVWKAVEQDDGHWRVRLESFPKIVAHKDDATSTVELTNYQHAMLIDPAISWFVNGSASLDKGAVNVNAPDGERSVDFGAGRADYTTRVNGDGSVSTMVKEDLSDVAVTATGPGKDDAPVNMSAHFDKALVNLGIDGFKPRTVFDVWGLLAAHRADLAAHGPELKGLLKELAAPGLKFSEGGEASKVLVTTPAGAVALSRVDALLGVDNAGPQSSISLSASADGLSLPIGLAPPGVADLIPSKIDIAAKFAGIDIAAAANEAIADMRLDGGGPAISDEDSAKVAAALLSAGPLRLEFAPSRIVAPAIDADFQGDIRLRA